MSEKAPETQIQRYDLWSGLIYRSANGKFVKYHDVQPLLARIADRDGEVRSLESALDDEEASHQEALSLLKMWDKWIDELRELIDDMRCELFDVQDCVSGDESRRIDELIARAEKQMEKSE